MQETDARRILGVDAAADAADARAAYRARLLRTHPDVSGSGDATERTVELTRAYHLLVDVLAARQTAPPASAGDSPPQTAPSQTAPSPATAPVPEPQQEPLLVAMVDSTTIGIGAPPDETLLILIDAAHRLGEISYLDPSAGLIEIVVEFLDAPTSSVLLSLQGRATGVTDVFCTVEPLSGGEAPPSDAVTRLLFRTLLDGSATG